MIHQIKNKLIILGTLLLLAPAILAPAGVLAATGDVQGSLCTGGDTLKVSDTGGNCTNVGSGATGTFNDKIKLVVDFLSAVIGFIAVVMIIIGGFRYITSGGSSDRVSSAKNTIIYAIIGLVIVALAQVIVQFVLNKTTCPHGVYTSGVHSGDCKP